MNRRFIALLLVGILCGVTALGTVTVLEQRRCAGAGGRYDVETRGCAFPASGAAATAATPASRVVIDYAIGGAAALVVGVVMIRLLLLATGAGPRRRG